MAIMLAKTYAALKSAGASEEEAQAAAQELADYENRLLSMDNRLGRVESGLMRVEAELTALRSEMNTRFTVVTWAVGINAAATIAILGALLHGSNDTPDRPSPRMDCATPPAGCLPTVAPTRGPSRCCLGIRHCRWQRGTRRESVPLCRSPSADQEQKVSNARGKGV
jgi:hypothetical protein